MCSHNLHNHRSLFLLKGRAEQTHHIDNKTNTCAAKHNTFSQDQINFNSMEVDKDDRRNQNPNRKIDDSKNSDQIKALKGKSCKGCLYYSSALKSNSRNPVCVGVPRTLQQGLSSFSALFVICFVVIFDFFFFFGWICCLIVLDIWCGCVVFLLFCEIWVLFCGLKEERW